jgi:hypothetical protein
MLDPSRLELDPWRRLELDPWRLALDPQRLELDPWRLRRPESCLIGEVVEQKVVEMFSRRRTAKGV